MSDTTPPFRIPAALLAALCLLAARPAASQQANPSAGARPAQGAAASATTVATRRQGAIDIDGRLDEAAWASARAAGGFVQKAPVEGDPAVHRTEVRVLFDDRAIYVAARMFDSDPASIARQLVRRDVEGNADWFAVGFDPRLDRRTAYVFFVSAANVQRDMYVYNDDDGDNAWDAVWESAVQIDSLGWTAELRIPLSQIRYQVGSGDQTWGINFARGRFSSNEETHFALMSELRPGLVSQFGTLTGIVTASAPRRIELRPYAVGGRGFEPAEPGNPFETGRSTTGRAGVDMKYGLGSSFTLDATVNPDFGQVEADPAVINLTAFETFFQERRPFFVEDARIFDFSLSGGNNRLFYGRRVGRAPTGRAPAGADFADVPDAAKIVGAVKLTGRTPGGLSLGAITALTDRAVGRAYTADSNATRSFLAEPRAVHSAFRARQDFSDGESNIGAIATVQSRQLPGDRSFAFLPSAALSAGFDWEHQWRQRRYAFFGYIAGSHVRGDSVAMIRIQRASNHYAQRPDAVRLGVDSSATSLSGVDWRMTVAKRGGQHWTGSIWAAQVTKGFEVNDLGFSSRQEVLDGGARAEYRQITPGRRLRSYRFIASTFHNWTHDALEDVWSAASWGRSHVNGSISLNASATLLNYWYLETSATFTPELADRSGTRGGPMMLAPRKFAWFAEVASDERKAVRLEASTRFERRPMGAGSSHEFSVGVAVRPSSQVEFTIEPQWEQARVGAQYVTTVADASYAPTFGARYIFADLERRELAVETRLDVTFSPTLTLQLFAQPLISSGDYLAYKQLSRPRSYAFEPVPAASQPADRDFNVRSLIGNAVVRWEYRPGSTIFVVWQRQQEDEAMTGRFSFSRDARALFGAPAHNVFLIKASYWLGL